MGTQDRRPDPSVEEILFSEGYRFDFFQAVGLLEAIYPERKPVGGQASPSEEFVRFRSFQTLAFPPSAIHEIEKPDRSSGGPARLVAAFMGLTGPQGTLPRHYTEIVLERMRRRDNVLRDFLDIFNHRLISLFYRAWKKYRFWVADQPAAATGHDDESFALHLFDLIGMGTKGLRGRSGSDEQALSFYVGLFSQRPHSASALGNILSDFFGIHVKVVQFVGQWLDISPENRTRLGMDDTSKLGVSAVAGSRIWDQQAKFKLRVGPLSYPEFSRLLPSGDAFRPFVQLTRYFAGQEMDFDLQLVLKAKEVPWCKLGNQFARLGFSTWLKSGEFTRDADQAVFSGEFTHLGALPG